MSKHYFYLSLFPILLSALLVFPFNASAASLIFSADTTMTVGSYSFTITQGSKAESITVNASTFDVGLASDSSITIKSNDRRYLTNSTVNTVCGTSYSYITLETGNSQTVTVTPSSSICPVQQETGGSSGGTTTTTSSEETTTTTTPTMPFSSTGEVTATASAGGKTSLIGSSNVTAEVTVPANTVSSDTAVSISSVAAADAPATPSGYTALGSQFFNMSASSGGSSVSSFSSAVNVVFSYASISIANISEDSLKIYRWDGSQWQALASVIDKVNKKVTATTTNFSYFTLMGTPATVQTQIGEGSLFKSTADSAIYVLRGGKKLHIPSWNAFTGAGYKIADVKSISSSDVSSYANAALIKVSGDSKVYYIENNKKRHIPTAAVFTGYNFNWGDIVDVSAKDRDGYPDVNLIKVSGDSKVYVLAGGMKRHVPNADVFNDYKYSWTNIFTISAAERDAYPDATLVKTASSANVYHLASGKKEWIKTAATFNSRGYKWADILTVSSKELATYPNQ